MPTANQLLKFWVTGMTGLEPHLWSPAQAMSDPVFPQGIASLQPWMPLDTSGAVADFSTPDWFSILL